MFSIEKFINFYLISILLFFFVYLPLKLILFDKNKKKQNFITKIKNSHKIIIFFLIMISI